MNITTLTNNGLSARLFAGITMLSLLLSAFPVAFFVANAATNTIYSTSSLTVNANSYSITGDIDASAYENITLSFEFDASGGGDSADGIESDDTFKYGYRIGTNAATEVELGSLSGESGVGASEIGSVTELVVPAGANNVSNLQFYFTVDSAGGTDTVAITNILVKGDETVVAPNEEKKVEICHWHNNGFNDIDVSINSIENAHGDDTEDIIPVIPGVYPNGQNLDTDYNGATGAEVLEAGCVVSVSDLDPEPKPETPISKCIDIDQNLFTNGSFEEPEVTNSSKWQKFNAAATGWTTTKVSDGTPTTLELQRDLFSNQAAEGDQYAELDGDHSTRIAQTIATLQGGEYELSWAFAGRHNAGGDVHNQMDILVNGSSVATEGPQTDPADLASADWTRTAVTFTADSESTEIAFADLGPSNSFGTYLDDAQLCLVEEPESLVTLHAAKIVCTDEADLPNGDVASTITADTAADWLAANPDSSCALVPDWEFEWGAKDVSRPNSTFTGPAGGDWTTFSGSTSVPLSEVDNQSFWVREVLPEGYIPFSYQGPYGSDKNFTAELNCHVDGVNFDNADRVDNPVEGGDYYCIAWNAPVDPDPEDQNQFTFSGIKFNNENQNRGRETGEENLYDWDFNMYKEVGGVWTFVASTTVNPSDAPKNAGKFVFPQQTEAGTYHVCEESQFGWEQVRQDWSGTPYHIITDNLSPNAGIEGPYCATAVYTDEADRSKAAYFGNFLKEIPTQYSDITMCKEDEQGNQLPGWQLALLGDTVDTLAFAPTADTQSMTAIPAGDYVVKAEGTYGYGNGGRFADARFSERKPGESNYTGPYVPWAVASVSTQGLAIQVAGDSTLWGNIFSPAHVYYGAFTQPALQDIDFSMYDNQYADNSGSIDLTLYQGFTGITGENGCVVFEDVPYGDYEVAELLQGGFENTSGLGSVTVDEDEQTFTVVNNDLSFVPPCELDIYSDEMTLVKETNQTAKATYAGNDRWTANIANAIWVWATGEVEEPEEDETYTFVETFTVTNPSAGNLTIAHDNWLKLTINDTVIERDQNGYQDFQKYDEDILAALVSGENRIEMEVRNIGTDGSNYLQNPAGALFHIEVTGEGESCARTTEPASSSLTIDTPATNGEVLSGTSTFAATYKDFDNDEDEVFWAIRAGSCNGPDMAGNAPASPEPNNPSTFNPVTGAFETTVDMSAWDNGDYCLVVNPREDAGAPNERETRTFVLANSVDPKPETETISGYKYNDTNGNGVLDDGETGEAGWTITAVEIEGTSATQTAITNEFGFYSFDLPAGEWSITEEDRDDWTQTAIVQNGFAVNTQEMGAQCSFNLLDDENFYFALVSDDQSEYELSEGYTCDFYNQPIEPTDPEVETRSSSRSSGTRTRLATPAPAGLVAGVTTDMCPFLVDYMQMGADNDPMEVMKLQLFLNIFKDMFGGSENPITGTFGATTDANVKAFQEHFHAEVLDPWFNLGIVPHHQPTGFVYKTTLWKINSIVCPDFATLPEFEGETLQSNVDIDATPIKD